MVNKTLTAVLSLLFLAANGFCEVEADELQQLLRSGEYVQALDRARANQDIGLRQQQIVQILS